MHNGGLLVRALGKLLLRAKGLQSDLEQKPDLFSDTTARRLQRQIRFIEGMTLAIRERDWSQDPIGYAEFFRMYVAIRREQGDLLKSSTKHNLLNSRF